MAVLLPGDAATFDEELLSDGLWLSLIGLGVVFVVLSVLAISIRVFDRIDEVLSGTASKPAQSAAPVAAAPASAPPAPEALQTVDDDALTAAAIGVAIALAERENGTAETRGAMARRPSPQANAWVATGRARELERRASAPHPGARGRR